jgi:septal ring factor EnvC (AmiA/AmiB activator)
MEGVSISQVHAQSREQLEKDLADLEAQIKALNGSITQTQTKTRRNTNTHIQIPLFKQTPNTITT